MYRQEYSYDGKRNTALDMLRGVAILIVVLGHAIQANISGGGTSFLWSKVIRAFQMPLMFLISGYAAGFSFPSRNPSLFIKKKAYRLFVPYLSWEIIHYMIVAAQFNDYRQFGVAEFFKEVLISDFWFLRMLFMFFFLMWIADVILHLIHKERNVSFTVITLLTLSSSLVMISRIPLLSQSGSLWYYLWFVFGYIGFWILKNDYIQMLWRNNFFRRIIVGACLLIMTTVIIIMTRITVKSWIVAILFCTGICGAVCGIENDIPAYIKHFLIEIGKNTLPVYAIHWCLLFSPFYRDGFYVEVFSKFPLVVSIILTVLIWVMISLLLIKLFRKEKISRILLLGEKDYE